MLSRIINHAWRGTLFRAAAEKVFGRSGDDEFVARVYRGDAAEGYVEERAKQKNWHLEQAILPQLLGDVPAGASVLDVPFGTGRFVGIYLRRDMIVYGLDISRDMLLASRRVLGSDYDRCRLQIGRADALPFADEKFDLTVCCRFLGLISYPMAARVLAELHRVSRSRALLYIQVRKDVFSWPRLLDRLLSPFGVPPRYFRVMGGNIAEDGFMRLLEETGFPFSERRVIAETRQTRVVFYLVSKETTSLRLAGVQETGK